MTASKETKKSSLLFKALGICFGLFIVVLALAFWPYLKMKQKKKSQNLEKGLTSFVNVQQPPTKEISMGLREDTVAAAKAQFVSDQDAAADKFGFAIYDPAFQAGFASAPPADANEQAKIDAAVKNQKDADQIVIDGLQGQLDTAVAQDAADVKAAQDAKAAADVALADLQSKLDVLSQKEGVEAKVIQDLQSAKSTLESVVAQLAALPALPQP